MKKRLLTILLVMAVVASSLTGCGGTTAATGTSTTGTSATATGNTAAAATATTNTGTTSSSGSKILRCASNISNTTMDQMSTHNGYQLNNIFDYLLYVKDDGSVDPWIITEWKFADDNMSCTLTMRDDVYFSCGAQMTSKDIQFSMMRPVKDRTMTSARTWAKLDNVEVIDDTHFKCDFNAQWPTFLTDISNLCVYHQADYEAKGNDAYFALPCGAGQFKLDSFDSVNSSYVCSRNDKWWGWSKIDNVSNLDGYTFTCVAEDTTRVSALQTDEFDLIGLVPSDDVDLLKSAGKQVVENPENRHIMLGLNYKGIFADENLRKAVSEAIDRQLIVDTVIGTGTVCKWPWVSGYSSNDSAAGYTYDLEDAKKLVAASSYDGSEITLLTSQNTATRVNELAQAIQSMLMDAGFNVKIDMVEEATYDTMRSGGKYDIAIGVFNTPAGGDGYKELTEILGGDIFGTGFKDSKFDALVAAVSSEMDTTKRQQAEIAAYQYVMDNYGPYLYLYCTTGISAYSANVDIDSLDIDSASNWHIARLQMK